MATTADTGAETGATLAGCACAGAGAAASLAKATLDPAKGKLIHIAGDHVAGDLGGALRAAGFEVERRLAFSSVAASALPAAFGERLDAITFHSPRAAETFVALGAHKSVELTAACLSEAIAVAISRR